MCSKKGSSLRQCFYAMFYMSITSNSIKSTLFFAAILFTALFYSACHIKDSTQNINPNAGTISQRILPPEGYNRDVNESSSWQYFLQQLGLLEHGSLVYSYNGQPISNQTDHVAVINYDVGNRDLQQCADAIIRLRGEYLFATGKYEQIHFKFTSGHNYSWSDHARGIRPIVTGTSVTFANNASEDNSYSNFRKYLDIVFAYAGTISLSRDLYRVQRNENFEIGDVIVNPGSPGHAVFIVDRAKNNSGDYIYLLAQGFTPAQSIHVLKSNQNNIAPWFKIPALCPRSTLRYHFQSPKIRRF